MISTELSLDKTVVMSHECSIFHKHLAETIAAKREERYEEVTRFLHVSLLALKATLLCLGSLGRKGVNLGVKITISAEHCMSSGSEDFIYLVNGLTIFIHYLDIFNVMFTHD